MPQISRAVAADFPHHVTQRGHYQQHGFEDKDNFRQYSGWLKDYEGFIVNREKSGSGIYAVPSDTTRLSTAVSGNPLLSMVALLQRHFQVPLPRRFDTTKYLEHANLGNFIN